MIDVQYYTKSIWKITFLNIWLFYSGWDRISATITIPTNVSSNGRQVLTTWSTRDNKPVFAFAFNNQNYLTISWFTQGAGNSEIYISWQLHIA